MTNRVFDYLSASKHARHLAGLDLGHGRKAAIWYNDDDQMRYDAPKGHAFSYYLAGGEGSLRVDGPTQRGWPGALCVFPEGHSSEWKLTEPFRFVHLYVPDDHLRASFAQTHDRDARLLDVPERTFDAPQTLSRPLQALAEATAKGDILAADVCFAELVAALPERPIHLKGGLAPKVLRRVDDWIEAHLDQDIRLEKLAALADLSEFHFHRMFRASRGVPPHRWVMLLRIARAKELLRHSPIADVAAACGFSHQSHLNRAFKAAMGLTPGQYKAALRNAA